MRTVKIIDRALTGLLAVAVVMALAPLQALAQDNERTYTQIRSVTVKGGMVPQYIELQKRLTEALKADGRQGRSVWREIRGDLNTFHQVSVLDNFAANDEPFDPPMGDDEWAEWVAGITSITHSSTRTIMRTHPEFATASAEGRERNLVFLRFRTVGPGRMDDYHNWVEHSLSPALKEGGADVTWAHVVLGGNNRTWISATYLDNWAAMDGPGPFADLSEEEIDALLGPSADMVVNSENRLIQFLPDLSF